MSASDRHRIVRRHERRALTGFSDQHTLRMEKAGRHPLRVQLGPNSVGWWLDELDEFLASRPRGGPPQRDSLGTKPRPPEPDPAAMARLQELLAEQAKLLARLGLEAMPVQKPERQRRSRSGP
jgi:predicted DNA-binding transcriptional regulator AlpA